MFALIVPLFTLIACRRAVVAVFKDRRTRILTLIVLASFYWLLPLLDKSANTFTHF